MSGCEESVELRAREHAGLGLAVAHAIVADFGALRIARSPCEMQLIVSHAVVAQAHWRRPCRRPMSSHRRLRLKKSADVFDAAQRPVRRDKQLSESLLDSCGQHLWRQVLDKANSS